MRTMTRFTNRQFYSKKPRFGLTMIVMALSLASCGSEPKHDKVNNSSTQTTAQTSASAKTVTPSTAPNITSTSPAQPVDAVAKPMVATHRVTYDGTVEAVTEARITPQVAGVITALPVSAGSRVNRGDLLARIDSRAATAQVQAAQAQVAQVQAQLDVASSELARQQMLYAKNYISKAALERAEANHKAVKAQAVAASAQVNTAATTQDFFALRAPFSGVVSQTNAVQGDMALMGQPIMTLYKDSDLRIAVSIPQSVAADAANLQPSQVTAFVPALGKNVIIDRVELLPQADSGAYSRTMRLYLGSLPSGITSGLSVKVSLAMATPVQAGADFTTNTANNAQSNTQQAAQHVYIPQSAIVRRGDMVGVYVQGAGGSTILRQVRLGQALGSQVEVLSGLRATDNVIADATYAFSQPKQTANP